MEVVGSLFGDVVGLKWVRQFVGGKDWTNMCRISLRVVRRDRLCIYLRVEKLWATVCREIHERESVRINWCFDLCYWVG